MNLTRAEKAQLAATLGCPVRELAKTMREYDRAASEEYARMILGQKVFTRGTDIREYRLFLLVVHVFMALPDERTISALFQTTTTQSRGLLRAVMSKYQYELQSITRRTLETSVKSAVRDPSESDTWNITIDSENVIEALNREIAAIDGTLPQISRARGTVSTFEMRNSSYEQLKLRFGV